MAASPAAAALLLRETLEDLADVPVTLDAPSAAEVIGVGVAHLLRLARRGEIRYVKRGPARSGGILFTRRALAEYLAARTRPVGSKS